MCGGPESSCRGRVARKGLSAAKARQATSDVKRDGAERGLAKAQRNPEWGGQERSKACPATPDARRRVTERETGPSRGDVHGSEKEGLEKGDGPKFQEKTARPTEVQARWRCAQQHPMWALGHGGSLDRETAEPVGPSREDQGRGGGPESGEGCVVKARSATPEGGDGGRREIESLSQGIAEPISRRRGGPKLKMGEGPKSRRNHVARKVLSADETFGTRQCPMGDVGARGEAVPGHWRAHGSEWKREDRAARRGQGAAKARPGAPDVGHGGQERLDLDRPGEASR